MGSVYDDDNEVERLTRQIIGGGQRIFQIFKMAGTDEGHVSALLDIFDPPQSARVLDLGCGVGEVAAMIAEMRGDLRFTLANISPSQLAMCPDVFDKMQCDMNSIPASAGSFDAVMVLYSLGHGNLDCVMSEAARILTPGGVFFIYDIASDDGSILRESLSYDPRPEWKVFEAASRNGFGVDRWGIPCHASTDDFMKVMDRDAASHVLHDIRPVFYRLILGEPSC